MVYKKIQILNYSGMSNHESKIYNFKVQMPSLNQVNRMLCLPQL